MEIDKSSIEPIAKFAYLKEYIVPRVRKLIDSLPFTEEGYEMAKEMLKEKYGDENEILTLHIKQIMNFLTLPEIIRVKQTSSTKP